jgi:IS5 family transposase
MRKPFQQQQRFDCQPIENVELNFNCRDEMIPILAGLQHLFSQPGSRDRLLQMIAQDVNQDSRRDIGRQGYDDWQVLVLAGVRLGCNLDYDKLQDLAEQHRAFRQLMGIGDWTDCISFHWRRIRDTLCLLKPETIEQMNHLIVGVGQSLDPDAAKKVRADSFVMETNIHYPTESSLILDGMGKILPLCNDISKTLGVAGWRQYKHLLSKIKNLAVTIAGISSRKGAKLKLRLKRTYQKLLKRVKKILRKANELVPQAQAAEGDLVLLGQVLELEGWIPLTQQVCQTATRRVIHEERVPNSDKLFSLFESHTQLYRRGKHATPNQFGRLLMVYEDAAGFISHYHLMPRDAQDADVVVEQTRIAQDRHQGAIQEASFDRGFYSAENEEQLQKILSHPCLPKKGPKAFAEQLQNASLRFREARQRHSGIESAIGALQSGNGLARCRDHSEVGFERYLALGILGRNLHVLGKILIRQQSPTAKAGASCRSAA